MTTPDDAPVTLGDRYVLLELITRGTTSEIWRAHDDVINRTVAVKVFTGEQAAEPGWRRAFRHNAKKLSALSHPGIAKVHDADETEDSTWLAMAMIDGAPLGDLTGHRAPDPATALDRLGQTAMALKAAHDAGITHGDLTAAHVLVRADGSTAIIGFPVVTDADRHHDLTALGALLRELVPATPDRSAELREFDRWLNDPKHPHPPADAGEIARTALALAAAVADGPATPAVPVAASPGEDEDEDDDEAETPEAARARKSVRNRLIAIGAIVVIFGAALLAIIDRGGSQVDVPVPNVVGLTLPAAQDELTQDVLRADPDVTDPDGTVVSQTPAAGTEVKAGSQVQLTVAETAGG